MIQLLPQLRILLAYQPVDFRKGTVDVFLTASQYRRCRDGHQITSLEIRIQAV
jgi:hypothetical protein